MSTSLQIKQIHTLKNILGLDDDLYRENSTMSMKEKVMNMMTMKMEELVAECEQAKLKFADIMLDDNADYRCKDSRRLKCTNIEAQMDLLQSMMDKISNMTCEVMLPPMARI